jgi:hypothetical protein
MRLMLPINLWTFFTNINRKKKPNLIERQVGKSKHSTAIHSEHELI